ncbi:MAG: hypothetical protein P4L99_01105 [Chthoniobacter sp.]|nr:hypothetical protein [Chthoniobacter sp.]
MNLSRPFLIASALLLIWPGASLWAQNAQPSPAEQKLRESLRNTMLQLRTSENDKAVAQAAQAEAEDKVKALTEQVEKITKQMAADKTTADKAAADLQSKIEERDKEAAALKDQLEKSVVDNKNITDIARTKEAQRAKLEEQTILLNRRVADQQTKNASMFKIANEILARYEKFGLGDALTAREPFTGITRVKLQSLFEEYQDKLVDQRIKPVEATTTPEAKATPAPDKAGKPKTGQTKVNEPKPKS